MIADVIDYLLHGPTVRDHVDLDNPHTVEKIAIAQARQNADLWSMALPARRMWGIERKQRERISRPAGRVLHMAGR